MLIMRRHHLSLYWSLAFRRAACVRPSARFFFGRTVAVGGLLRRAAGLLERWHASGAVFAVVSAAPPRRVADPHGGAQDFKPQSIVDGIGVGAPQLPLPYSR
uniref:Uncharacterized protein n=1 Tax=Oryza brachyantha TaxID=4533 RepID=J3NA68_ORYBR